MATQAEGPLRSKVLVACLPCSEGVCIWIQLPELFCLVKYEVPVYVSEARLP